MALAALSSPRAWAWWWAWGVHAHASSACPLSPPLQQRFSFAGSGLSSSRAPSSLSCGRCNILPASPLAGRTLVARHTCRREKTNYSKTSIKERDRSGRASLNTSSYAIIHYNITLTSHEKPQLTLLGGAHAARLSGCCFTLFCSQRLRKFATEICRVHHFDNQTQHTYSVPSWDNCYQAETTSIRQGAGGIECPPHPGNRQGRYCVAELSSSPLDSPGRFVPGLNIIHVHGMRKY